jgi:hypothetical protein
LELVERILPATAVCSPPRSDTLCTQLGLPRLLTPSIGVLGFNAVPRPRFFIAYFSQQAPSAKVLYDSRARPLLFR